jgi:hypothetical protein
MKDVLKRMFAPETAARIEAAVIGRVGTGKYEVRDDMGRILRVDSSLIWPPGKRVIVQSGRIVASAGAVQTIKSYEV